MCNVLLVTCNSDASSTNLRHAACDAISAIGRFERNCALRERHLYDGAVPTADKQTVGEIAASMKRGLAGKDEACTNLMMQEVRMADVVVIAAPVENGQLPRELSEWIAHLGLAARMPAHMAGMKSGEPSKVAIVVAENVGDGGPDPMRLTEICESLRTMLAPLGVADVALFEADAEGYPLRHGPLMLICSRSRALH